MGFKKKNVIRTLNAIIQMGSITQNVTFVVNLKAVYV